MILLLGGSKRRYSGQGLKMAEGRAEGQPFLVQTRRTVTIILANPSVFGLIIGASQHAHRAPASLSASVAEASEVSSSCCAPGPLAKKPARENLGRIVDTTQRTRAAVKEDVQRAVAPLNAKIERLEALLQQALLRDTSKIRR